MTLSKTAAAAALALLFGSASQAAQATVLTFDGDICSLGHTCDFGSTIDQSYGDSANVDVQYNRDIHFADFHTGQEGSNLLWWDTNYNELSHIAWGGISGTQGVPLILLHPLNGASVTLTGLDLGGYFGSFFGGYATQLTIFDGADNLLYQSGPITIGASGHSTHFAFDLTSTSGLAIEWGPDGFNVGIDNVAFEFTGAPPPPPPPTGGVPEPQSWALMIAGFGLVGAAMRRRARALA